MARSVSERDDKRLVTLTVTAKIESVNKITDLYGSYEIRMTKINTKSVLITTKLQRMFVKYVLSTMGVSKESTSKFLIDRFHLNRLKEKAIRSNFPLNMTNDKIALASNWEDRLRPPKCNKKEDPQVWATSFPHLLTLKQKEK